MKFSIISICLLMSYGAAMSMEGTKSSPLPRHPLLRTKSCEIKQMGGIVKELDVNMCPNAESFATRKSSPRVLTPLADGRSRAASVSVAAVSRVAA